MTVDILCIYAIITDIKYNDYLYKLHKFEVTKLKRMTSIFLAIVLIVSVFAVPVSARAGLTGVTVAAEPEVRSQPAESVSIQDLSEQTIKSKMEAVKEEYPEGTPYEENVHYYVSKGKMNDFISFTGTGCAGFALLLSDAAFGNLPFFELRTFTFEELRVGDMLRLNNDTHMATILEKRADSVIIGEGNYNKAVHWGRVLTKDEVMKADYVWTRYPDVLARYAAPLPDGKKVTATANQKTPDVSMFYCFEANDTAWSAICSSKQPCYCMVYNAEGRLLYTTTVEQEDEWYSFMPECEAGENVYVLFYPKDESAEYSITLSNTDPNTLPTDFLDVKPKKFYINPILWAVKAGITTGLDTYHFGPDKTCTRAQVVTFLWRAKGCPEPKSMSNPFTDIKEKASYYKAVLWAVETGVTSGMGKGTFNPGGPCTRGQVVTFLWRANGCPEPSAAASPFTDVTGGFFLKAVLWAVETGVTAGTSKTEFSPNATCTRGQVVTFLYRDANNK